MQKLILHDVKLVHSQPGRGISAHPPIGTGGTLGRLKSLNLSNFQLPVEVVWYKKNAIKIPLFDNILNQQS